MAGRHCIETVDAVKHQDLSSALDKPERQDRGHAYRLEHEGSIIMLLAMTCLSAVVAVAADLVRRTRREADLRRRWRSRPRQPWRLT
jgi:hypothetical protein